MTNCSRKAWADTSAAPSLPDVRPTFGTKKGLPLKKLPYPAKLRRNHWITGDAHQICCSNRDQNPFRAYVQDRFRGVLDLPRFLADQCEQRYARRVLSFAHLADHRARNATAAILVENPLADVIGPSPFEPFGSRPDPDLRERSEFHTSKSLILIRVRSDSLLNTGARN